MTKITVEFSETLDSEQLSKTQEIFLALLKCGGLWGVKGGKTIIHFDSEGLFQGVELDYWPFRRRRKD